MIHSIYWADRVQLHTVCHDLKTKVDVIAKPAQDLLTLQEQVQITHRLQILVSKRQEVSNLLNRFLENRQALEKLGVELGPVP